MGPCPRQPSRPPQLANAEWFERHAVGNFGLASDPKLRAWKATLAKSRVRVIVSRAMILGKALECRTHVTRVSEPCTHRLFVRTSQVKRLHRPQPFLLSWSAVCLPVQPCGGYVPLWRVSLSFGRLSVSLSGGLEIGVSILHAWINTWSGSFRVLRSPCGADMRSVAAGSKTLSLPQRMDLRWAGNGVPGPAAINSWRCFSPTTAGGTHKCGFPLS